MRSKSRLIIAFVILFAAIAALCFMLLGRKESINNIQNERPAPIAQDESDSNAPKAEPENISIENEDQDDPAEATATETEKTIPEKFLLQIPFYSQAPLSKWDAFHEDMCEEASVLNGALYLENKKISKAEFEAELQKLKKLEEKELEVWKSTTVAQIKKVADIHFEGKIKSKIIDNPTIEQIEAEIAAGNPIIAPLAGRDIGNPNFTPPGPVYHMLVIKGYDFKNFITNDVGTRKGDSYFYTKEMIMKNIHDWNETDIHLGEKQILVLYK
jgi:hypothetical protein